MFIFIVLSFYVVLETEVPFTGGSYSHGRDVFHSLSSYGVSYDSGKELYYLWHE